MSTAIHVITESSDHYNFCEEVTLTQDELLPYLKEQLDDEFDYIDQVWADTCEYIDRTMIRKELHIDWDEFNKMRDKRDEDEDEEYEDEE